MQIIQLVDLKILSSLLWLYVYGLSLLKQKQILEKYK